MDNTLVRELIDAGIHFGHRVGRWNPKMKPYVYCARNSIHIIDIKETIKGLLRSKKFLTSLVGSGKDVLFVGTKRQARKPLEEHAKRCDMPYVTERWLGGTLTNFRTIRSRLNRLFELEAMEEQGLMDKESKKMEAMLRRELHKIKRNLDGMRDMNRLPGAMIVIDAKREHTAVREARKLKIPTVCLLDTDSDPTQVDLPIPGNDDAMRAIELIVRQLADAIEEGKAGRSAAPAEETSEDRRPRSRRMSLSRAAEGISKPDEQSPDQPESAGDSPAPQAPPAQPENTSPEKVASEPANPPEQT